MTPQKAANWLSIVYAGRVVNDTTLVWEYESPLLEDLVATADVMGCDICRTPFGDKVIPK